MNYKDRISKHRDGHALLDVHVQVWGWRLVMLMYQGFHLSSVFLVGNGQHSCQLRRQLVTCIFTRFTISSSKPSKCHLHQDGGQHLIVLQLKYGSL